MVAGCGDRYAIDIQHGIGRDLLVGENRGDAAGQSAHVDREGAGTAGLGTAEHKVVTAGRRPVEDDGGVHAGNIVVDLVLERVEAGYTREIQVRGLPVDSEGNDSCADRIQL